VKDVPVVYTMVVDPAAEDLTTANLCGVRLNAGFDGQLGALLAVRPGARRVGTIYDPRTLARVLGDLRDAAARLGLSVAARPARSPQDVAGALRSLGEEPLDAFLLLLDPALIDAASFEAIRTFASREKLIFVVPDRSLVAGGGTFSYAPGFAEMGAQAAQLAELIVSGALAPGQIGAIYPTTRYIALNPVEAERLGIPLSPESLIP
jgi:putative ABC transport system substrate-binding protein